jgi:N-methylhydantoinase A/oxoprolinase/acetone carboxylase beta subunit
MVQNDGSIMDLELAIKMPILTIGAGQTNSFIGGCKVAKVSSAVVLDIGGTSTDIGSVIDGVAKRSCHATKIGGVELHFAMPDVLSLALGGGSIINDSQIGPESVARRLKEQAQCFGGKKLTLTDVGVFLDILDIPGASKSSISLTTSAAKHHLATIGQKLVSSLRIAMGKHRNLPIVVVGGAAAMVRAALTDTEFGSLVMIPEHSGVANAYGASLAEVSATITVVLPLGSGREELLDKIKAKTCEEAILKGAALTRIANVEIIPYAYSKDGLAKVSVTALGRRNWRLPKDVAGLG